MKLSKFIILLVIALLLFTAQAWSFYCGNTIISEADVAAEVLAKCGNPAGTYEWTEQASDGLGVIRQTQTGTHLVTVRDQSRTDTYSQWTYNFGPYDFLRVLTFKNGKLTKIETQGYGWY